MEQATNSVCIVRKEGPVVIESLNGAGLDTVHTLWNAISCSESFPPVTGSAFYVLKLKKPVEQWNEIEACKTELITALNLLARTWIFSGGSFMKLENFEAKRSPIFECNANQVEAQLLARSGLHLVSKSSTAHFEAGSTYQQPPLGTAIKLSKAAKAYPSLYKLLNYYYLAWDGYYCRPRSERSYWFIPLYKVRDVLKDIYGREEKVRSALNITEDDWNFFGKYLNNNDLRHPGRNTKTESLSSANNNRVYQIARSWIEAHISIRGF